MKAALIKKSGGPDNLIIKNINFPDKMKKSDIFLRHTFIGVNFDDILLRRGDMEIPKLDDNPYNLIGFDGIGIIEKVGSDITKFKVGQRVGYAFAPIGSYCEKRVINANYCIAIPDEISDEQACSILRKGLVAHTMLFRCNVPKSNHTIMVTGAGSGVGQIIARWAKYSGLKVIGVIGSEFKRDAAIATGCDIVINYNSKDAIEKVADFTNKMGVHAVYDSIGKATFPLIIRSLHVFGMYVSYGNTSGNIEGFDPYILEGKSLFFTKPRFELYKSNRSELVLSAHEMFEAYRKGAFISNPVRYAFSSIANAHKDLENRKICGSVVLSMNL